MSEKYDDYDEYRALLDGARALRLNAELVANRTTKPEPPDVATFRADCKRNADTLEEMASCYAQAVAS